jgi:Secretion system C-terminal sorting domain
MKRILFVALMSVVFFANAQTQVLTNYNDNLVKDLDNQAVFSEKFDMLTNSYYLKKIDDAGTVTNFVDYTFSTAAIQYSNNQGSATAFYNRRNPTYVKGNKAIVRFMQGTTATHLLHNGSTTSVFDMPNASVVISVNSDFILNDNNAIIYDYSRIYETNYTAAGTSLIFASPSPKSSATGSIECLSIQQNDGGLYWIDIYNFSKVLYKRVGGVNTEVLSVSGADGLYMHQNKLTGDVYVSKGLITTTNPVFLKFDNSGNETYLTTPSDAFFGNALCLVNNKLMFATFSGDLISLDLTTNEVSQVNAPDSIFMAISNLITNSNGSIGYALVDQIAYFTDGISIVQIGGDMGTNGFVGDFCGDNLYIQKGLNQNTFLSEIEILTPFGTSNYWPNNTANTSFTIGVASGTGIYSKSQLNESPYSALLYKSECSSFIGIKESDTFGLELGIYPNPSSGNFNLEILPELIGAKVSVYNMLGQNIESFYLRNTITNLNLQVGMYVLGIEMGGKRTNRKLIIQ